MSTDVQPTALQIQALMTKALDESVPHEAAVEIDDAFNVLGNRIWGYIPGQTGLPDETISSHIEEVSDDPKAKFRFGAIIINHALNILNPNRIAPAPGAKTEELGHGIGAESGDLIRAARVVAILLQALGIPWLTVKAGEDPKDIIASIVVQP